MAANNNDPPPVMSLSKGNATGRNLPEGKRKISNLPVKSENQNLPISLHKNATLFGPNKHNEHNATKGGRKRTRRAKRSRRTRRHRKH